MKAVTVALVRKLMEVSPFDEFRRITAKNATGYGSFTYAARSSPHSARTSTHCNQMRPPLAWQEEAYITIDREY